MIWRADEQIGPYIIVSQLGQGGMATVYKAHHPQLDRTVAIKVMHANYLDDNNFIERFKREAQIVARLEHPHIIPIYDFNEQNGIPYLVMKLIEGKSLKEQLFKKVPSLDDILHIMTAIADAISYAHKRDILHRDIKPSNIVIDSDNVPYLADFGLARIIQAGESTMSADVLLGTPNYMSPEQAKGSKQIDHRTDIYSFGIVLYELVVGRVPFSADTPLAVIHDHIYKPLPLPSLVNPEIKPELEAVLVKALAKNPRDRYQSANEMIEDFKQVIHSKQIRSLDDNRSSIADESLARIRQEYLEDFEDAQANVAQSVRNLASPATQIITSSPLIVPENDSTSKIESATVYQKEVNARYWKMGGLGAFILILFLITAVVVNASNTFMQLLEIGQKLETDNELSVADYHTDSEFPTNLLYELPDSLEDIEAAIKSNPDDAINYLALAAQHFSRNNADLAYRAIQNGLTHAEDEAVYLATAASLATNANDHKAAIIYALLAYDYATKSDDPDAKSTQEAISQYLYEQSFSINTIDLSRETEQINEILRPMDAVRISTSPMTRIFITNNQVAMKRTRFARLSFNTWTEEVYQLPEGKLVKAQYDLLANEATIAKQELEELLNASDTPDWIATIADDLLNSLED